MRHYRARIPALIAVVLAVLLVLSERAVRPRPEQATANLVTHIYDGDTLEVHGWGKVRLLGVDALDDHNLQKKRRQALDLGMSERQAAEWSRRAAELARQTVLRRNVTLEFGPRRRDDYGRTLAYVYLQPKGQEERVSLNLLLLEKGLAIAYRRYEHPLRPRFLAAEAQARQRSIGLWKDADVR